MNPLLINISSFSILVPGVIGLFRFRRIDPSFLPFLYLVWVGALNEVLSYILVINGRHTIFNNNVYALLEPLFIAWFFKSQHLFRRSPQVYWVLQAGFVLAWL